MLPLGKRGGLLGKVEASDGGGMGEERCAGDGNSLQQPVTGISSVSSVRPGLDIHLHFHQTLRALTGGYRHRLMKGAEV